MSSPAVACRLQYDHLTVTLHGERGVVPEVIRFPRPMSPMRLHRSAIVSLLIAATGAIVISCGNDKTATAPAVDPNAVAYSFVVIGCNRLAAPESIGVVSTANVQELNRTFSDIASITPKPSFLFFDGDLIAQMNLMTDDVLFLTSGNLPMGRKEFADNFKAMSETVRLECRSNVQEITVSGDLAVCWNLLEVDVTPIAGGTTIRRAGNTLTVFRRGADGQWRIWRDANLMATV